MQNPTQKFIQNSIVFGKPGTLSEEFKIWRAPTAIDFNNFYCNFTHIFYLPISTRGCSGFFILFRTWVICQNQKISSFYTLTEPRFINNSRSK